MANIKNSVNRSNCGQRRVGKHGCMVSTASIAWVVANLLALSQPSICVNAFTHPQNTRIVPSARMKHVKREFQPRSRCPSSLNYCNIECQPTLKDRFQQCHVEIFQLPNITNGRWKTLVRSQMNDGQDFSSDTDHQFIVDEYLESIDRRYKRVHSKAKNDRSQRNFTSAWAWLAADESSLVGEVKQRNEEDALCVLGLAELASVRLLQKHRLPVTQSQRLSHKDEDSIIIEVIGEKHSMAAPSVRAALVTKSCARFLNSMKKVYTYHGTIMSLRLRAWYYRTLRRSGSTFTQVLAAFSLMSRYMTRGRLASQFAILVACAIVVTRPFKA